MPPTRETPPDRFRISLENPAAGWIEDVSGYKRKFLQAIDAGFAVWQAAPRSPLKAPGPNP